MPRLTDRIEALEQAARLMNGEVVVIDCEGLPTPGQIAEWEGAAKAGRRLFIAGPGLDWGWMPGAGMRHPWEPVT